MATIEDQVVEDFDRLKIGDEFGWLIFGLKKDGLIGVLQQGPKGERLMDMFKHLPEDGARWAVGHFSYVTTSGGKRSKVILVNWIPPKCSRKAKMQGAMWAGALKRSLVGVHTCIEAHSQADLAVEEVLERASKFERDEVDMAQFQSQFE